MGRGFGVVAALSCVATAGCSALLNFSDSKIPIDAATDAPYTSAECMYKEPNDSAQTAALITPADVGPAAICPNDLDYYQFAVPAMTAQVSIEILFTNSVTGDLDLTLYNGDGSIMIAAAGEGFANNREIDCPGQMPLCAMLAAGTYIFEVSPAVPGNVNSYGIQLTITPAS
jgi:hypothetical protein